jgi:hypothetical protein
MHGLILNGSRTRAVEQRLLHPPPNRVFLPGGALQVDPVQHVDAVPGPGGNPRCRNATVNQVDTAAWRRS